MPPVFIVFRRVFGANRVCFPTCALVIGISSPRFARPILGAKFAYAALVATMSRTKRLATCWLVFLDLHLLITKPDDLFFSIFTSLDNGLLGGVVWRSARLVARHL